MKPTHDNVLVRPLDEKTTAGGIIIPDNADREPVQWGVVLALGPGRILDNGGTLVPPCCERSHKDFDGAFSYESMLIKGAEVLFYARAATEFKDRGQTLYIVPCSGILLVKE